MLVILESFISGIDTCLHACIEFRQIVTQAIGGELLYLECEQQYLSIRFLNNEDI